MKKMRTTLAVLLALILALSTAALAAEPFTDVSSEAYYADAVAWAVEKEITDGMGNGQFRPDFTVNRAQAVTFLWRMAGRPEPKQTATFDDVEADANNWWYQTAVQWAVGEGITDGMGNGKFQPATPCSRGMILTMLYRMQGRPIDAAMAAEVPEAEEDMTMEDFSNAYIQAYVEMLRSENGFTDVPQGAWYELPGMWATMSGILNSNQIDPAAMAVQPGAPCPRGEVVYFLYRASGEAPLEGAVKSGKIPETVLLDAGGVTVTATGIKTEGYGDVIVSLTVKNGSEKLLRVDGEDSFVNTYAVYPQVCIPVESEDGWTFYADAVVSPGETAGCQLRLNSLDDIGIDAVRELELRLTLTEVEKDEDGYYSYVDELAAGETVAIRTSLYDAGVSYDMEGTVLLETNGLQVRLLKAENDHDSGPKITLYAYNGGGAAVALDLAELKLDGEVFESFFSMNLPAGKRAVSEASAFLMDYDNLPTVSVAELTLRALDPETWETVETFDPVTVTFAE